MRCARIITEVMVAMKKRITSFGKCGKLPLPTFRRLFSAQLHSRTRVCMKPTPCPLLCQAVFSPKSAHRSFRRHFFRLPDASSFSPFSGGNDDSGNEQRYSEQKILPCVFLYNRDNACPKLYCNRYSQRQLYDLVADVDNYHRFLPYCLESKVLSTEHGANGTKRSQARLTVGFLAFKESYVSEVTCTPYSSVEVSASAQGEAS